MRNTWMDELTACPHTSRISEAGHILESERLARRVFSVVEEGSADQLGELVHPSITLVSIVRPGVVVEGKEDFVRFAQDTLANSLYQVMVSTYQSLDDDRVIVEGRIRWIDDDRVIRDDPVTWAMEFRDGLLIRAIPARTLVEAETILGGVAT
jgi:hypothetical protein